MTNTPMRADGRTPSQLRPVSMTRGWSGTGEGSVLIEFGNTRVLCIASFTEGVPRWKRDSGEGWVTGEYSMLPRATEQRSSRESVKGKVGGRTQEISRLIGRSLRGIVDVSALGENTIVLDCDVLRADGGTRTAAIEEQNPQKLGQLMSENHERLQQLGVSHDVIDTLVDTAHQNNALGAKVTGGGLGGCMIALVETEEDALHLQEQFMKQGAQAVWIQSLAKKENTK